MSYAWERRHPAGAPRKASRFPSKIGKVATDLLQYLRDYQRMTNDESRIT